MMIHNIIIIIHEVVRRKPCPELIYLHLFIEQVHKHGLPCTNTSIQVQPLNWSIVRRLGNEAGP